MIQDLAYRFSLSESLQLAQLISRGECHMSESFTFLLKTDHLVVQFSNVGIEQGVLQRQETLDSLNCVFEVEEYHILPSAPARVPRWGSGI